MKYIAFYEKEKITKGGIYMTLKQKFWTVIGRFLYRIGYLTD